MFRTAGRTFACALHTSVAEAQRSPRSLRAGAALSTRWFKASGYNLSGHSGQLDEYGIATGAEREELEWKSQLKVIRVGGQPGHDEHH